MSAFDFFDDIRCIHHAARAKRWPVMQARFGKLGIVERADKFPAWPSPADGRIGRALSHRRVLQDAAERGLRSVMVIEDETLFLDRTDKVLSSALAELRCRNWKLLNFGALRGSDEFEVEPDCEYLRQSGSQPSPHAIAYAGAVYSELLEMLPMSFTAMETFLGERKSLESVLANITPAFTICPALAAIPPSLPFQAPADQRRFVA